MTDYVVRFTYPNGTSWAALDLGAWGFVAEIEQAARFPSRETAAAVLIAHYKPSRPYGSVEEVAS